MKRGEIFPVYSFIVWCLDLELERGLPHISVCRIARTLGPFSRVRKKLALPDRCITVGIYFWNLEDSGK